MGPSQLAEAGRATRTTGLSQRAAASVADGGRWTACQSQAAQRPVATGSRPTVPLLGSTAASGSEQGLSGAEHRHEEQGNKELVGNFANDGATWCAAAAVNAHDFPQDAECRAVPYGMYDVGRNRGHVCVGRSADTSQFSDGLPQTCRVIFNLNEFAFVD